MFGRTVSYDLLWDAAASGSEDRCAFGVLEASQRWILTAMHRHGQELVTLLWRTLGNEQDVCDAYQTTFLHLAHLEGGGKPRWIKAYLFRTASNIAITMLRQRTVEKKTLARVRQGAEDRETVEADFDSQHLAENLRRHIAQLPEHLRTVLMLRDFGALSYAEVARTIGISTGTARVYRCKAVQLLAAWMKEEE